MAKITTIGMYSFDPTLFDGVVFPAGINKQLAVDEILTRSGEFEIIYPDVSFFKAMLEHWANKHYRTFEKWAEGLAAEFDPLYNYDRYEEYEDTKKGKTSTSGTNAENISNSREAAGSENSLQNVANNSTATTGTTGCRSTTSAEIMENGGETENTVSAFDSSSYEPKDKQTSSTGQATNATTGEVSGTDSSSTGASSTATSSGSVHNEAATDNTKRNSVNAEERNEDESIKHTAHLYGNIGVTTSAQMLREFLDVERWNIYEHIADLFVDEFCILVY